MQLYCSCTAVVDISFISNVQINYTVFFSDYPSECHWNIHEFSQTGCMRNLLESVSTETWSVLCPALYYSLRQSGFTVKSISWKLIWFWLYSIFHHHLNVPISNDWHSMNTKKKTIFDTNGQVGPRVHLLSRIDSGKKMPEMYYFL